MPVNQGSHLLSDRIRHIADKIKSDWHDKRDIKYSNVKIIDIYGEIPSISWDSRLIFKYDKKGLLFELSQVTPLNIDIRGSKGINIESIFIKRLFINSSARLIMIKNIILNNLEIGLQDEKCNLEILSLKVWGVKSSFSLNSRAFRHVLIKDTNFKKFDQVHLVNVAFEKMDFSNIVMPNELETGWFFGDSYHHGYDTTKKSVFHISREWYISLSKKSNYQIAFDAKILMYNSLLKNKEVSTWDKIILLFNKYTNDYGTNFLKPILIALSFSLVFSIIVGLAAIVRYENLAISNVLQDGWLTIFFFINPVHKISDFTLMSNFDYIPQFIFPLSFISRIIISILAFQSVQAFRKYLKF